ncbi:MAG: ATP-binding protein, partial [Planctomycetes bacterium]|nr:ATP-binding protein [Planctomycetota bacterium]
SPPIVDIEFVETELDEVLVQLVEEGGQKISARILSDGTLRFMGLLAALFTVPEGTIILLEEIENGLHPTRIHLLMELLEQFAAERNLQIIATTHSSQVLMGLSESALQDAVLFARDEEHPGTIVKRLGDLDHFDEVTKSTRIDELFTTGWLEFAV